MKIKTIYIGGWFQRTMLQLTEIYDFLLDSSSQLEKLNKNKLVSLRNNLNLASVEYKISGEEYIHIITADNITIKIFEDGLVTLAYSDIVDSDIDKYTSMLQNYYETQLSPAFNYLFSLGAPVPKELAGIKNVYPYFIVCSGATQDDLRNMLSSTDKQKYYEFSNKKYTVLRGDKYYFINTLTKSEAEIARYIEEQIFIREFKGQLHRYLNIHRIIWEKIDSVKKHVKIRGSDIITFTTKLESYAKTITLIDGRIKQMGTYISTREKIAKEDAELAEFLEISGYRYETLRNTLNYISYLWDMTKNYVVSAQRQFESLKTDMTSQSVESLTVVSTVSALACILSLFQSMKIEMTVDGWICIVLITLVAWGTPKILNFVSKKHKYEITDIEIEKDIK